MPRMPPLFSRDRKALRAFHVFNQGFLLDGERARRIFLDREDKQFFLELLSRHLRPEPVTDARSRPFQHLRAMITLCAFNVMGTHFHLIVWQHDERGIAELMDRVKGAYSRYFNDKYGNTAALFNGPVRAKPIDSPAYFRWLVGYVHDNHRDGVDYEFSSHRAWLDSDHCPSWLDPEPGVRVFGGLDNYRDHLEMRRAKKQLDAELGFRPDW